MIGLSKTQSTRTPLLYHAFPSFAQHVDFSAILAATYTVSCKRKTMVQQPRNNTSALSRNLLIVLPASQSHIQVVLNVLQVSTSINSPHKLLTIADGRQTIWSPHGCQMGDLIGTVARRAECPLLMGPSVLCQDSNTLHWGDSSSCSRMTLPSRRLRAIR